MNRWLATQLAQQLLREHGLDTQGWSFRFNRHRRTLGLCRFTEKQIELSLFFTERNDQAAVRDTLLHEIAHALAGPEAGHGPLWKQWCVRVGAKPQRLDSEADMPPGRYRATCPGCGTQHTRHRAPRRGSRYNCIACGPERGRLQFRAFVPGARLTSAPRPPAHSSDV